MPNVIVPIPWTEQPPDGARIAYSNPITKGITRAISAVSSVDPVTGTQITYPNGFTANRLGVAALGSASFIPIRLPTPLTIPTNSDFTCVFSVHASELAGGNPGIWREGLGTTAEAGIGASWCLFQGTSFLPWVRWNSIDILLPTTGEALVLGGYYTIAFRVISGVSVAVAWNGKIHHTASHTATAPAFDIQLLGAQFSLAERVGPISDAVFFLRGLSDEELVSITNNISQVYEDEEFPVWFTAGGGAAALEGAATASATAAGALTTQIPIIGAAATVATATGALSTSIPLLGAAVVTVTALGDLSAQIKLDGAAIAQALAAGGITTGIPLAGAASGAASASGALDAAASLAAAAQAIATAVGSLTTQIMLSGAAISQAFASGELTAPGSGLSGTAAGQVTAAGSLTTGIPLVGAAQAYATGVGGLTTIIPLSGAAASVSAATGDLTVQTTLTGAAIAQALAGGVLTTQVVLSGAAVSLASAAGVLTGGTAIVDQTWLVRPKVRRYSVKPEQRIYKGSR